MRDRIKELRRVKASELIPNERNWRKHPKRQRELLQSVLHTIGFADALIARETDAGKLVLIDGHLRADVSPNDVVPVLVVDLDEREADNLLLLLDPLTELATRDDAALEQLLADFETSNDLIQRFVNETFSVDNYSVESTAAPSDANEVDVPTLFQILIECRDEDDQKSLFNELIESGRNCRILNL